MIRAYIANASLCNIPFLFLCFLCHPYIFTIFVENFYCSLVVNTDQLKKYHIRHTLWEKLLCYSMIVLQVFGGDIENSIRIASNIHTVCIVA